MSLSFKITLFAFTVKFCSKTKSEAAFRAESKVQFQSSTRYETQPLKDSRDVKHVSLLFLHVLLHALPLLAISLHCTDPFGSTDRLLSHCSLLTRISQFLQHNSDKNKERNNILSEGTTKD